MYSKVAILERRNKISACLNKERTRLGDKRNPPNTNTILYGRSTYTYISVC